MVAVFCSGVMLTIGWIFTNCVVVLLLVLLSPPPETVTPRLPVEGALLATFIERLICEEADPAAIVPDWVQVRVLRVHVQPAPLMAKAVNPVERFATTVMVPEEAILPKLSMNIGKLTLVSPWLTKLVPERAGVRSMIGAAICVRSLKESFALLVSPPPETVATFVTVAGALAAMATVRKIGA